MKERERTILIFSLSSFTTLLLTVVSSFEILDLDLLWVSLLSSGCFQFSFFSLSLLGLDTVFLVVLLLSVWQSKQITGASLLILRRWELVVGFALHPSLFALCFSVFFLDYCLLPIHVGFPSWSLSINTSRIKPFLFEIVVGHKEWKFTLLFKILMAGDVLISLNRSYGT